MSETNTVKRGPFPTREQLATRDHAELAAESGYTVEQLREIRDIYREQDEANANLPTPPPCPSWCAEAAGHRYELASPGEGDAVAYSRFHSMKETDRSSAYVTQLENYEDGRISFPDPPTVSVWIGEDQEMSVAQAREAAAALLAAADDLERIEREQASRVNLDDPGVG